MKQSIIGVFQIGHENVQLVAMLDNGDGEFYFCPESESLGRIKVGIANSNWENVVAMLLHETLEYAMDRQRVRYRITENLSRDHASYLFNFNHCQFTEIVACVSSFVTPALPRLAEAWAKRHKKKVNP